MTPVIAAMLLLKVSLLLTVVLALAQVMRRAPAAARHRLWSVAFAALLALPLLGAALPAVAIRMPAWAAARAVPAAQAEIDRPAALPRAVVSAAPAPYVAAFGQAEPDAPARSRFADLSMSAYPVLLGGLWLAGAAGAFALLALALWRARRVRRGAAVVDDEGWAASAHAIALRLGMRDAPRVLMSDRVVTPMAGGLLRPTVFVPPDACAWDAERRDIVLAHEIAHLAGNDPLRQIVARVVLAIYWFHPLAWLAARQAEAAREQACDEAVIALGTRPSTYARVLLDFADGMPAASPAIAALPMIQRTLLEKRLMAILNNDARPRTRRLVMLPAIAVSALTLTVAAAQPAAPAVPLPSSIAGSDISIAYEDRATPAPAAQPDAIAAVGAAQDGARRSACWWKDGDGTSFEGSITIDDDEITEQVGRRGATRVMQKTFGDTRVCMLADGVGDREGVPSSWIGDATRVVMESRRGREERRLEIEGSRLVWTVNGAQRAPDAEAASWRGRMLAVLDPAWELSMLRGEESSLRGEISSIHGERSSLQGEISSLHGEVSSMHGEISSIRGEESSLRGEISSIRGELSSMQGEISSERGEISSLNGSRYDASDAERARISERIRRHETKIAEIQKEIANYDVDKRVAEVERQIARLDADKKTADVQRRLSAFDVDKKVRELEAEIARLDVNGQVAAIERKITALNTDARAGAIEARLEQAVRALNR